VLYETLFFDKMDETNFYQQDKDGERSAAPPNGFHYTKSVLFHLRKG
jgi:hypothetical protein